MQKKKKKNQGIINIPKIFLEPLFNTGFMVSVLSCSSRSLARYTLFANSRKKWTNRQNCYEIQIVCRVFSLTFCKQVFCSMFCIVFARQSGLWMQPVGSVIYELFPLNESFNWTNSQFWNELVQSFTQWTIVEWTLWPMTEWGFGSIPIRILIGMFKLFFFKKVKRQN